jgi:hypothetical protein
VREVGRDCYDGLEVELEGCWLDFRLEEGMDGFPGRCVVGALLCVLRCTTTISSSDIIITEVL